jgi:hypothetical protein
MPAESTLVGSEGVAVPDLDAPHALEREVHRRLQSQPGLDIKSLVVRRLPNGVCLEGRIEAENDAVDLRRLMSGLAGVDELVNHIVICSPSTCREVSPPPRG